MSHEKKTILVDDKRWFQLNINSIIFRISDVCIYEILQINTEDVQGVLKKGG